MLNFMQNLKSYNPMGNIKDKIVLKMIKEFDLEPLGRLELPTYALRMRCSTN